MSTNVWNFDADRKIRNLYFDWAVTYGATINAPIAFTGRTDEVNC